MGVYEYVCENKVCMYFCVQVFLPQVYSQSHLGKVMALVLIDDTIPFISRRTPLIQG